MERQDSISSMGSAASGMSGMSAASSQAAGDGLGAGAAGDMGLDQTQTIATAVFGMLGTLYKERWEDSKRYLTARVVMEHLQLLLILLQPQFLWVFQYKHWLWEVCNYFLLKNLVMPQGAATYYTVMYVMVVAMVLSLAACGWIAYTFVRNSMVPNKWPVKLLRLLMMLFYQLFYITILNYLMGPLNCNWLSSTPAIKFHSVDFGAQCLVMPHLAQLAVAAVFSAMYIIMGGLIALADVTPNPVSQNWLATAHSTVEVKAWAFRTLIVLCANLLTGHYKLQSTPIMIAAAWLAYVYIRWQPYYFAWVNHVRVGMYAMTAYISLMLTINCWKEDALLAMGLPPSEKLAMRAARTFQVTLLGLTLMPAAVVIGVVVSWLRLHLSVKAVLKKFSAYDLTVDTSSIQGLKDVHRFVDEYEVELAARCCRSWQDYEDGTLDDQAVKRAEVIIKAGLARFPHSAHMVLIYMNFLGSVLKSQQSCTSQLQASKKLEPNWCDRYVIFVREQQQLARLQQQSGSGAESALDLVGYVEFQHNYRQLLRVHKSALYAQRSFWKVLLHSNVTFKNIVHAFRHIESCRSKADKTYKTVLERYPTNIKVLRAYARFLEDVKNDPWSASKYYTEADKLEEQEGADGAEALNLNTNVAGEEGVNNTLKNVDEKNNAVCVINATGTIQMANKVLLKMFGYRKGELEGKNVSLLMPQPFSGRHNGYLRAYQTTGEAKILDQPQQVVALHKEHYVFPITLVVTRVSGTGAEAVFMGVIKPSEEDPDAVKAWITPGGMMLCVDARFTDWFGKVPADCVARPFNSLGLETEKLQALIDDASVAKKEDFQSGKLSLKDVALMHKYAEPQRMDITLELGGTESQRLFVAVIRRCSSSATEHLMVTDAKGRIVYITSKLATLLGSTPKGLVRTEFAKLMAQPFMQLHGKWMKDMPAKIPMASCRAGAPAVLVSQQRTPVPAKLDISCREQGEENIFIAKVNTLTFAEALNDRRLSLSIDSTGTILNVGDSSASLFGFKPSLLVGRNLSECVDVFLGLPESGGMQGMDMETVLTALVHMALEQKESSWRCGVHPPMTPEEVRTVQSNVIQANMLANQTKAGLLQLEVQESEDDTGSVIAITVHLWRSDMLLGVVEVDREGYIAKAGCCALHQPGPLLGIPSSAMLRTPLSHWLNVPSTYEGLLMDSKKKGALKRKLADVKVGPLRHANGRHNDGDTVHVSVQAVVKEGTGPERLVLKLGMEKPSKGNPNFVRRLLGLEEMPAGAGQAGPGRHKDSDDAVGNKSFKPRAAGGVKFGDGASDGEGAEEGRGSDDAGAKPKQGKSERLMEWVRQASGVTAATAAAAVEFDNSMANASFENGVPPPPEERPDQDAYLPPVETNLNQDEVGSVMSGGDGASSMASGSEAGGGYQSDFKRGKRLRKLARMLSGKQAQKASTRFYRHTVLIIAGLLVSHIACFIASVVLIDSQKQYIDEVEHAGNAVIALHKMAIECRVMDAIYQNRTAPGIFTAADLQHHVDLLDEAIEEFQEEHEKTYLGGTKLRRFYNRKKYHLQSYWEEPMWNATEVIDTHPPQERKRAMGAWELGNELIAAAREVQSNHKLLTAGGKKLSDNRFWQFVLNNAPWAQYNAYKITLYGLVERVLSKISEVSQAMVILMVLEGCVVFLAATVYVAYLIKQMVLQRANLFSVFLVIPTGFLRALASKQVQLDEDADSDEGTDAGDMVTQKETQQQETQKLNLSLFGKKGKSADGAASQADFFSKKKKRGSLLGRLASKLNPLSWFGSGKGSSVDTGKKQLVRNSRDTGIVTGPFLFWAIVITMIYAISIAQLSKVQSPFRMLNMINFLVFRVTRGTLFGLEIVLASPDTHLIELRKEQTLVRLEDLKRDYTSFLYGFSALGPGAEPDDLSTDVPAIFEDDHLAYIFFRHTGCMRKDQSACFPPGHKFYDVTHNGLDAMATRFIQETQLLLADDPKDINLTNARFDYLWQIGSFDLFDGMHLADTTFRGGVEDIFTQLRTAHTVVFVFSLLGALVLWLGLIRPTLQHSGRETCQIAEMLSQLPAEMDVEGLVAQVLVAAEEDDEPVPKRSGGGERSSMEGLARGGLDMPSYTGKGSATGGLRGSIEGYPMQKRQVEVMAGY